MIERVGFLGVGHMGGAMAREIASAGYDVMVFDRRTDPCDALREYGAKVATSPAELGRHAQLLEVAIAGDDAIERALFDAGGVAGSLGSGSVVALHSTMSPNAVQRIAARLAPRGIDVIDAPVSGGRSGARSHRLCFMIGGDGPVAERCRAVFSTCGSAQFHLGPLGAGMAAKAAQQIMTTVNILGVAEATRLMTAFGIDSRAFLTAVAATSGQSRVADQWLDELQPLGPTLAEAFQLSLTPGLELAESLAVETPAARLSRQLIRETLQHT